MNDNRWEHFSYRFTLEETEAHIWKVPLRWPVADIQHLQTLLADDERTKAQRFYFEKDRHAFIVSHATLRILLCHYLQLPVADAKKLSFSKNDYGKPELDSHSQKISLQFNISHSHDLALFAFTRTRIVGIDIEYKRDSIEYLQLAEHSFSPFEQKVLLSLPQLLQQDAFYNCWARKEAYIKARGLGLSLPLHLFDVSFQPGEPAALLASREDPLEVQRWSFYQLLPDPAYAAALVVEGRDVQLQLWQFPLSLAEIAPSVSSS